MEHTQPTSSDVYYAGRYWNNLQPVVEYMNRWATGDVSVDWMSDLFARRGRPFERALILNCGNGWVERDLLARGVIESAIGIDISEQLVTEARAAAPACIDYVVADINDFAFDLEGVDLVVNVAAAHHIAYIDRVFRRIHALLPANGVFVSYDYVGPHRNCYPAEQWEALWQTNESLPPSFRKVLHYPNVDSMVRDDPTEAIHSELIVAMMHRYFDFEVEAYLGGAIAYDLLSLNPPFHRDDAEANRLIGDVLQADANWRSVDPPNRSLFAYLVATPRNESPDPSMLAEWTRAEVDREAAAALNGGRYYPRPMLEALYETMDILDARRPLRHRLVTRLRRWPTLDTLARRVRRSLVRQTP